MVKAKTESEAKGTQLLDRAVSILKYLGDVGGMGAGMATIEAELGLTQSTTHRIVQALERHGLIERERKTKRYRLGLALFAMGARAADGTGLRQILRPALVRIAANTGDSVFLMARSGFNTVCVDREQGTYIINSLTGHVGGQIPMGVGPASQAILAHLSAAEANNIINANAEIYPQYGDLTADLVRRSLGDIRNRGYAIDNGELVAGISAIAVPILPPGRDAVAAIAVNLTTARLTPDHQADIINWLKGEVGQVEGRLNPLEELGLAPDFEALDRL